jgi:caa(3)-type oxidase subunit IV
MSHHDAHHDDHHGHHVTPAWLYHAIFGALLCLTVITVWIAQFDFGSMNTVIAMLVATVKASLVALFFMHLLHDERLNLLTFGFGLLFVCLFFLFPLVDIGTRTYVDPVKDNSSVYKAEKAQQAQDDFAKKHSKELGNLSNLYNRGFVKAAEGEGPAKPEPVPAPAEGGEAVEGTQAPAIK